MLSDSWETGHCAVGGHWCGQAGVVLELWSSYNGALKGTLSWSASRWSSFDSLDKRHSKLKLAEIGRGVLSFFGTNMPYCGTAVPHHPQIFFPTSPYRQSPPSKRSQDIRDGLGKNSNEGSKDCVSQKCHTFSSATETPKLSSTPQRPY